MKKCTFNLFVFFLCSLVLFCSCARVPEKPDVIQEPDHEEKITVPEPEEEPVVQEPEHTLSMESQEVSMEEAYRHFFRGVYYENRDNMETALEEYDKSFELSPNSPYLAVKIAVLYELIARLKQNTDLLQRSLEYTDKALKIDDGYLPAYRQQGNIYDIIEPPKAIDAFKKVLELNPRETDLLFDIGRLYHTTGNPDQAAEYLEQYLDRDPDQLFKTKAVYNLFIHYLTQKEYYEAVRTLNRLNDKRESADQYIAQMLSILEEDQPALMKGFRDFLDQKLMLPRIPPDQYRTLLTLVTLMGLEKQMDPVFQVMLEHFPNDPEVIVDYAKYIFWNKQSTNQAFELLASAVEKGVTNRDTYFFLGAFYREQKSYEEALRVFTMGAQEYPNDEEFLFQLGITYERMGNLDKAMEKLRETIQFNPDHSEARNYLAYVFAEEGINLEEALEHIQIAISSEENNAAFIDTLGWIYYKMGRYMDAVKELEKAVQLMEEPEPVILDHLGDAYLKVGTTELALKRWKESLALDPSNTKLQKKIIDLETRNHEPGK